MRTAVTIALGLVFSIAFMGAFLLSSVTSFVASPTAIVGTMRAADLRGVVIDVIEESLAQEVADSPDPRFRQAVRAGARIVIGRAMTEDWFYGVLAVACDGFAALIQGGADPSLIDLRDRKQQLASKLAELGEAALRECAAATGSRCDDIAEATTIRRKYAEGTSALLATIPDQTNLSRLIEEMGPRFLPAGMARPTLAQEAVDLARKIEWTLIAAMLVLLALIAAINRRPPARALAACGAVLIAAAAFYLIGAEVASRVGQSRIRDEFAARVKDYARDDSVVVVASAGAERIARRAIDSALGQDAVPIAGALIAGFAAVAGSIALHRRDRRAGA